MQIIKRWSYSNIDLSEEVESQQRISGCSRDPMILILIFGLVSIAAIIILTIGLNAKENPNLEDKEDSLLAIQPANVTIEIQDGVLLGKSLQSRQGREFFAFYNIPYGQPPIGQLRFEPPNEFTAGWTGVRDATQPGEKCIQKKIGATTISGNEDCLYLSLYSPKLPSQTQNSSSSNNKSLLPVMFYILGGAFIGGRASIYGGEYLMDEDVVVVLPEFRVGTLGHLSTGDLVIPGNMGLKDQVMALRWVQKNIARFGGDPKRVTIFGNSSGGCSIHGHILSTMSIGLFNRAISQSGVGISPEIFIKDRKKFAQEIGSAVGCPIDGDTQELADCLKNANASDIIQAEFTESGHLVVEAIPEDGDLSSVFLSDTPLNLMQLGQFNLDIPWVIGVNSAEMGIISLMLNDTNATLSLNENWNQIVPGLIQLDEGSISEKQKQDIAADAREFYFGNETVSLETKWGLIDMVSDRSYVYPAYATAILHSQFSNKGVYLYWLTHEPIKSISDALKKVYDPPYGVSHADEVQFLFPYAKFPYISNDSADYEFSKTMVKLWANFGNEGTPILPSGFNDWEPVPTGVDGYHAKWLQLDEIPKMADVMWDRMQFWETFPLSYLFIQGIT